MNFNFLEAEVTVIWLPLGTTSDSVSAKSATCSFYNYPILQFASTFYHFISHYDTLSGVIFLWVLLECGNVHQ